MEVRFDRTGAERKALVTAISEVTGEKAEYMGAPSFAYKVGGCTITKDGMLEVDDGAGVSSLLAALDERGFVPTEMPELPNDNVETLDSTDDIHAVGLPELADEDVSESNTSVDTYVTESPDAMVIELPDEGFSEQAFDNLVKLVAGKSELIRKAAGDCLADGAQQLPVTRENGKICFPWFRFGMEPDEVAAWSLFIGGLYAVAKKQKRVVLKEKPLDEGASEKFAMRCFLLKLGFIGEEYKTARKVILAGLSGDGSRKKPKPEVSDGAYDLEEALADARLVHEVSASFDECGDADDLSETLADAELIHEVNALLEKDGETVGDCLSCGQSMSEPGGDGAEYDRLFCTERQEYVEDDSSCAAYNK